MPDRSRFPNETFAVALQSSNKVFHPEAAAFLSQAKAQDYIAKAVAADPSLEGTLHVHSPVRGGSMSTNAPPPIADPEDLLGTYAFLALAAAGSRQCDHGPAGGGHARLHQVDLTVSGNSGRRRTRRSPQPVSQDISLYGPGDIVGIDARAVIRTEPRPGVTNFESNYLAAVDFYDEDFPWRYTPAPASGLQLLPWIALIVLKQDRIRRGQATSPIVRCPSSPFPTRALFPPAGETVGVGARALQPGPVAQSVDRTGLARHERGDAAGAGDPQQQSRPRVLAICCARACWTSTPAIDAFVIPAFESGRLAGLGYDPVEGAIGHWRRRGLPYGGQPEPQNFPYYYPLALPHRRPRRLPLPGQLAQAATSRSNGGHARLRCHRIPAPISPRHRQARTERAFCASAERLQVPDADLSDDDMAERDKYENWDQPYPDAFEVSLAKFINLPDDYSAQTRRPTPTRARGIGPGVTRRSRSADHLAAVRALAVADPAPALQARWHAPRPTRRTGCIA